MSTAGSREFWEAHRQQLIQVDSFSELMTLLLDNGHPSLIYRGQKDVEWDLTCTLARALREQALAGGQIPIELYESMVADSRKYDHGQRMERRVEHSFVDMATRMGIGGLPPLEDRLGWWELMQHYGAPTRLLDWTRSPFVGLWFACWKCGDSAQKDSALWVYNSELSSVSYRNEIESLDNEGPWTIRSDRDWSNKLAELAIARKGIVPLIVIPHRGVERIAAQQSILTLIPDVTTPTGFAGGVFQSLTTKILIRREWRSDIQRVTESLGLTEFSLFRNLDTLGSAISRALNANLPRPLP
jgi:FRG domain